MFWMAKRETFLRIPQHSFTIYEFCMGHLTEGAHYEEDETEVCRGEHDNQVLQGGEGP